VFSIPPILPSFRAAQKIGGMPNAYPPPIGTFVQEFDRLRLIVIFQRVRRMLHLVDGCQFDSMAFELNRHAHLFAWVSAGYVALSAANPAIGI
jgi:hypothetical protein